MTQIKLKSSCSDTAPQFSIGRTGIGSRIGLEEVTARPNDIWLQWRFTPVTLPHIFAGLNGGLSPIKRGLYCSNCASLGFVCIQSRMINFHSVWQPFNLEGPAPRIRIRSVTAARTKQ